MMQRALLFAKGMCMGVADVIPGVSGGTLALVLGVYAELVESIKNLHLRWVPLLWRWLRAGRRAEDRDALLASLATLNLPFLVTLGAGIACAIAVGSAIIPGLMEGYPTATRAFFFGLILASVYVPLRMIHEQRGGGPSLVATVLLAVLCTLGGYTLTDPSHQLQIATTWRPVQVAEQETLKDLTRRQPSALTAEQIYWHERNEPLRQALSAWAPERAQALEALRAQVGQQVVMDKKALKARSEPYQGLVLPQGQQVQVPQPALWFVFVAGMIAICAMILPGISGSYILLIFGVYFFILNALKGLPAMLLKGQLPTTHLMYVGAFVVAMAVGILSFSRVLSYLLRRHAAPTLGALVGLMVGCLRGIWPFRISAQGVEQNVWPTAQTPALAASVVACLVGIGLVVGLTLLGRRALADEPQVADPASATPEDDAAPQAP